MDRLSLLLLLLSLPAFARTHPSCKMAFSVVSADDQGHTQQGLGPETLKWCNDKVAKKYPEVKKAVKAAQGANDVARDSLNTVQRAYVSIREVSGSRLGVSNDPKTIALMITFPWENFGWPLRQWQNRFSDAEIKKIEADSRRKNRAFARVLRGYDLDVQDDEVRFMDAVVSAAQMLHYARVSFDSE